MGEADSLIGKTISHYRVVERLGGGAMGVVDKDEDNKPGRFVAPGNIRVQSLNGSQGHQLTHFTSKRIRRFAWSPDGKRPAVLRWHRDSDVVLLKSPNGRGN